MKKFLIICSLFVTFTSLNAQEYLTKAKFIDQVWDYKTHDKEIKLKTDLPVIIDFYATWCGPCKMLTPELIALQKELKGKVLIYKIDVDKDRELAALFGANALPTIFFIPKSGRASYVQGYRTKDELKQMAETYLSVKP